MLRIIPSLLKKNRLLILFVVLAFNSLAAFFLLPDSDEGSTRSSPSYKHFSSKIKLQSSVTNEDGGSSFIDDEMKRRKDAVDRVCQRERMGTYSEKNFIRNSHHHDPPTPNYEAFYFDRSHDLAWCPVYKAATTTWLYYFCLLGGMSESSLNHVVANWAQLTRGLWPSLDYEEGEKAFTDAKVRFFIVRHPFERVLSAYRDKLEDINKGKEHGTESYYANYGRAIVAKYRTKIPSPKFERVDENYIERRKEPTFAEFVQYLNDIDLSQKGDDHWMPYYLSCTPCLLDYHVIAKFETLDRDSMFIVRKANLTHLIDSVSWKHLTKGQKTNEIIQEYFSTITRDQLFKLYDKYRIDFEMFEYEMSEFANYAVA